MRWLSLFMVILLSGCGSTYLIRGEGGTACTTVLQQVQGSQQARSVYRGWLAGYLTRYNFERESKLGREFNVDTLLSTALQHCQQKPLDDFSTAAEQVVKQLKKKQ